MKKISIILLIILFTFGCGCKVDKASDVVKEYLEKFNNQDAKVLAELENIIKEENLKEEQEEKYRNIMLKQYQDLNYKIIEESYNGDEAFVTVKITVYDLYRAQKEAEEYKNNHPEEFLNDQKEYDAEKFLNFKLDQMKKKDKRVEYTIDFQVIKKEEKWKIEKVNTETLEKIHGIYNEQNK